MLKMADTLGGRAVGISSFSCSCSSSKSCFSRQWNPRNPNSNLPMMAGRSVYTRRLILACSAVQESSTSSVTTSETKEAKAATPEEAATPKEAATLKPKPVAKEAKAATPEETAIPKEAAAPKPKPAAKAPTKPLPQLMEEEIIPPLLEILQAQKDISDIELSFQDNRLEGSFLKEGNNYSFWAFFPNGDLTGPKGFSLSSFGSEASTVEPFLVDEKRLMAKLIVFWVEKRLAAQGIIPVWDE